MLVGGSRSGRLAGTAGRAIQPSRAIYGPHAVMSLVVLYFEHIAVRSFAQGTDNGNPLCGSGIQVPEAINTVGVGLMRCDVRIQIMI